MLGSTLFYNFYMVIVLKTKAYNIMKIIWEPKRKNHLSFRWFFY